jgi:hypothetical protein
MPKKVAAPKKVTRENVREGYTLQEGMEIPPIVKESIYPWGALLEKDPGVLSFFVACGSAEEAEGRRSPIQSSGNNYYSKRRIPRTAVSRIVEEDGQTGVRSWAVVATD